MPFSPAPFTPTPYTPPDFTLPHLAAAPDVTLVPAPKDFVAPEGYHAMSIYPEYLKIAGQWTLARDSRMDCVAVVEGGHIGGRRSAPGRPRQLRLPPGPLSRDRVLARL